MDEILTLFHTFKYVDMCISALIFFERCSLVKDIYQIFMVLFYSLENNLLRLLSKNKNIFWNLDYYEAVLV